MGGGIVGVATAFFLAERGETDVVLLEQSALGSGTTKGGLGGIRHQFVDELDVRLSQLATEFWRDFDAFTSSAHDFQQNGYLFIAETAEGLAALREPMPLYQRLGIEVELVGPGQIAEAVPGIRADDLKGGRLGLRDGYGAPLEALAGFAAAAALEGVRFVEHARAESLVTEGGRVVGARTTDGEIRADRVLLATGIWTAPLARTAGVEVPIWPYRRSIMEAAGPFPTLAAIPMVIEWESGFHFRPYSKNGGGAQRFAMPNLTADGTVEKGPAGAPPTFGGSPDGLEVPPQLEPWVKARGAWRMEQFADLRITDRWSCHYEMTPDDHPIVGAVPGTPGLYLAAGFSGHGFMHAPATAQLIVEEMLDGTATTLDIGDLSIERFRTGRRPFTSTVL
ncbi:MAG TPA: FAD-binding oxidoreductase [Candidatus Limnocylindria bacterium]|nr:FAD-binding oxidoreductase [Candidatus Limnocylindria bacterium]